MLPLLLLLGGAALNAFAPIPYLGLPLLAAVPLIAAMVLPPRVAVGAAVIAPAAALGLDALRGRPWIAVLVDVLVVALIGALGLWTQARSLRQEQSLSETRHIALLAQRAVLPEPPHRIGQVVCAARYQPAQVAAQVGGDFYGLEASPFGVRAVIGDVRGKGMRAVSTVSLAVGAFREHVDHEPSLHGLARWLDRALERAQRDGDEVTETEEFATALLVQLDLDRRGAQLLGFGHTEPYLITSGRISRVDAEQPNLPLGIGLAHPEQAGPPLIVPFPPGATLLLVTDGVTEARDAQGTFFDPCRNLPGPLPAAPEGIVDTIIDQVTRWTGGQRQDDVALLALSHATAEQVLPAAMNESGANVFSVVVSVPTVRVR